MNKNKPFTLEKCIKDQQGRYVLINRFSLHREHIMVGCEYAPNVYHAEFYSKLLTEISEMSSAFSILAGDFNCTMDPDVDQNPPAKTTLSKMREATREVQYVQTYICLMHGECSTLVKETTLSFLIHTKVFPKKLPPNFKRVELEWRNVL